MSHFQQLFVVVVCISNKISNQEEGIILFFYFIPDVHGNFVEDCSYIGFPKKEQSTRCTKTIA